MAKKQKRRSSPQAARPKPVVTETLAVESAEAEPTTARVAAPVKAVAGNEFNPDYTYVKNDLRRIAILAGTFFAILIILSFIL